MNRSSYQLSVDDIASRISFQPSQVIQGPTITIKRCEYTGFASNVCSIEQAIEMLEYIACCTLSENCMPFAVSLVDSTGAAINMCEDNGEFGSGDIIAKCLKRLDGYNTMSCVTRKVRDSFVHEMIQPQKARAIKEASSAAIELLYQKLTNTVTVKTASTNATTNPNSAQSLRPLSSALTKEAMELISFNDSTTAALFTVDDSNMQLHGSQSRVLRTASTNQGEEYQQGMEVFSSLLKKEKQENTRIVYPSMRISLDQFADIEGAVERNNQAATTTTATATKRSQSHKR